MLSGSPLALRLTSYSVFLRIVLRVYTKHWLNVRSIRSLTYDIIYDLRRIKNLIIRTLIKFTI